MNKLSPEIVDIILSFFHHEIVVLQNVELYHTLLKVNRKLSRSAVRCFRKHLMIISAKDWHDKDSLSISSLSNPLIIPSLDDVLRSFPRFYRMFDDDAIEFLRRLLTKKRLAYIFALIERWKKLTTKQTLHQILHQSSLIFRSTNIVVTASASFTTPRGTFLFKPSFINSPLNVDGLCNSTDVEHFRFGYWRKGDCILVTPRTARVVLFQTGETNLIDFTV